MEMLTPVKVGDYHYIVRSGYWLKKYRYQKQSDGLYHIVESFTSYKSAGENLLLHCMIDGYYRTRLFEESLARDYWRDRRENCVVVVEGKPKRCMHCDFTEFKDVIYDEPSELVDEDKFVLGGCCINEYSHNWECAQCQVKYRDESLW